MGAKPYRLLIASPNKPDRPERITRSVQMIGWGLWHEFSKLPHVTLSYQDSDKQIGLLQPTDFTLIHCCTGSLLLDNIPTIRKLTSRHIINIMEAVRPKTMVDYNFSFLPYPDWKKRGFAPVEEVHSPYIGSILKHDSSLKKWPGSILLDHSYPRISPESLWCDRLHEWLTPIRDKVRIGQLICRRFNLPMPPNWIHQIPETNYPDYLKRTAQYENFIMTHPESYGHSITDMVIRGIRTLIPVQDSKPFAKHSVIDRLRLPIFSTREEMFTILKTPPEDSWREKLCTDMPNIVFRIDSYCQKEIARWG